MALCHGNPLRSTCRSIRLPWDMSAESISIQIQQEILLETTRITNRLLLFQRQSPVEVQLPGYSSHLHCPGQKHRRFWLQVS
jgi:hypothetical protein